MTAIEIARRFVELGKAEEAQRAYMVFLHQEEEKNPKEELEAASYIFFSHGNHEVAYTIFVSLYNRGFFQEELMNLMLQAFYLPNVEKIKKQYEENCRVLEQYPYFFRQGFPTFDDLPIWFFPFNDKGFLPFYRNENRFGEYVDFNDPVIDRYFFKDLEKPIFAADVYSQYQLEYLNDTVRKSEWVGRENHIYLHYTHWETFCSYLQCLTLKKLLKKEEKFVFLIEEEGEQYPIDFQERFGIDYSQYPIKPIGIREVNRMIWHTQLSSHNGGDFFNEIFYGHPNLLAFESVMFEDVCKQIKDLQKRQNWNQLSPRLQYEMTLIKKPTAKDCLVAVFLNNEVMHHELDTKSRIVPALFFQPHFYNIFCELNIDQSQKYVVMTSNVYNDITSSPLFKEFKYIKTFTPMRRITTSYGATVRFMVDGMEDAEEPQVMPDVFSQRLLNRSFMVDPYDRLYRDSRLVRFEDGKLNPKATFTALAEFLDIPYTESLTYCSSRKGINPESFKGNDLGFDPAAIYRTYDEYVDDADRAILEFFFQDAYTCYGYDFHYYKEEPVDMEWIQKNLQRFYHVDSFIENAYLAALEKGIEMHHQVFVEGESIDTKEKCVQKARDQIDIYRENRKKLSEILLRRLQFVNSQGQPLQLMKPLQLDPDLLEQPLYH